MVDVSRRLFLGGALAVAAAAVVARPAEALAPLPRIVGDGVHDDTAGLQALLNGEPVEIENDCIQIVGDRIFHFRSGRVFWLSDTIVVTRDYTLIEGAHLKGDFDGPLLHVPVGPKACSNHVLPV